MNNHLPELRPRNQCLDYMLRNGAEAAAILTKAEFDTHCETGEFEDGPYQDTFGEDRRESYTPYCQAFGKLKKGISYYVDGQITRYVFLN